MYINVYNDNNNDIYIYNKLTKYIQDLMYQLCLIELVCIVKY